MDKTPKTEKLNVWKVTVAIVLVGALCWLALTMLSGCATSFGEGDIRQNIVGFGGVVPVEPPAEVEP